MNEEKVMELARENGIHIYPEYTTAFSDFANAVIAAHTDELLKDAGEPVANLHDDGYWTAQKTAAGRSINYKLHFAGSPKIAVYSAEQVAAAVAKAKAVPMKYKRMAFNAELQERIAELEALCDKTYVASGADAYDHACSEMERWQKQRLRDGKEVGTQGSLCDGMAWLYERIAALESTLRVALDALEMVVVDVNTTPNAYEAQRRAIKQIKEVLHG